MCFEVRYVPDAMGSSSRNVESRVSMMGPIVIVLDKSSVYANENEPQTVNGPVVVRLTTSRFTGTVST